MQAKHLVLSTLATAALSFVLDFLFYALLMKDIFISNPVCHREMPDWPYMILGLLVFFSIFTYIVDKMRARMKGSFRGWRSGFFIGMMIGFGVGLIYFSVQVVSPLFDYMIEALYTTLKLGAAGAVVYSIVPGKEDDKGEPLTGKEDSKGEPVTGKEDSRGEPK